MEPKPEPLRVSGTLNGGLVGSSSATAKLGPLPKPPNSPFIDRNWKAAKFLLKGAARETIVEFIKGFFLGRKRQPAQT